MKTIRIILSYLVFFQTISASAQNSISLKWWNPADSKFSVIEGQAWPNEVKNTYDRFPARAEKTVNPNVWNISHSAAGLMLRFKSNASSITIRYKVNGEFAMSHMPSTGVSGIDLYAVDKDGRWQWAAGNFSFSDTITYKYTNLYGGDYYKEKGCEYRLYLPLYNAVTWLEIGVPTDAQFIPLQTRKDKPIVVYGTSIGQGACASRPGMAWTNILGRRLDHPIIDISFSGSGKLENSVTDLLNEIDAKAYILDCLPNLTVLSGFKPDEVTRRILETVHRLRKQHPEVPILLTAHSGIAENVMDTTRLHDYSGVNLVLDKSFQLLKTEDIKKVYLIPNNAIHLDLNSTIDGLHPNDVGMLHYADAFESYLRKILDEPIGNEITTQPCIQYRDGYYNWEERHNERMKLNSKNPPSIVFIGNSIIHYWGGEPKAPIARGSDSWDKEFSPLNVGNFGFGWDKIENVLWRIYHGELDGFKAKQVLIMIGTNNLVDNTNDEIIAGLKQLGEVIIQRQPQAQITLIGLLPRRSMEDRIKNLNYSIARLAGQLNVKYTDPGNSLLQPNGHIDESLFQDGLHPNAQGYWKIANFLKPELISSKK
ncbi:MAG: SGNH/GDSL hydrolase family protein [Bacteroidota bacterium]|nr:SGNH/GDSL hydrolase family protein [Bacteroidota bacterium]